MLNKIQVENILKGEINSLLELDMIVAFHATLFNYYKNFKDQELLHYSLRSRYEVMSTGILSEWATSKLEVNIYPVLVESPYRDSYTAYSLKPNGPLLRGMDNKEVAIPSKQGVVDFLTERSILDLSNVMFVFQDPPAE